MLLVHIGITQFYQDTVTLSLSKIILINCQDKWDKVIYCLTALGLNRLFVSIWLF